MSRKLLGLMILFLTQMIFAFEGSSGTAFVCRQNQNLNCERFRFIDYVAYDNGMIRFTLAFDNRVVVYSNHWVIKIIED